MHPNGMGLRRVIKWCWLWLGIGTDRTVEALLLRPGGDGDDHSGLPARHRSQGHQQPLPGEVSTPEIRFTLHLPVSSWQHTSTSPEQANLALNEHEVTHLKHNQLHIPTPYSLTRSTVPLKQLKLKRSNVYVWYNLCKKTWYALKDIWKVSHKKYYDIICKFYI